MNILFISPYFYPALALGGTPRAAYELGKELAKLGHSVEVATTDILSSGRRVPALSPGEKPGGMKVNYFPGLPPNLALKTRIFKARGLTAFLKANLRSYDFVHLHEFRTFLNTDFLKIWEQSKKPPFGLSAHGGASRELKKAGLKKLFDRFWGHRLLQKAAFLFATSGLEEQAYRELGASPRQIKLLFNGINPGLPLESSGKPQAFREKYQLGDRRFILFLGRLNWIKGLDFLIPSFSRLITHPEVKLVIAGPDDGFLAEAQKLAAALSLADKIQFLPFLSQADKISAIRACETLVLPSRYEIFGITLLEGLQLDKPVILTRECGLAEYLEGKSGAQIVGFGDQPALARAMASNLNQPINPQEAKNYCLEHFTWEKIARHYLEIIG